METEVTIVEADPAPEVPQGEILAAEQAEVIADAAVEVAQIEADKEIAVAEVHAETEQLAIVAAQEAAHEGEDEWRRNFEARLTAQEATQQEILSTLQALTIPPSPPSPLESTVNPEAMPEKQEVPEPAAPKRKPHHRLI